MVTLAQAPAQRRLLSARGRKQPERDDPDEPSRDLHR